MIGKGLWCLLLHFHSLTSAYFSLALCLSVSFSPSLPLPLSQSVFHSVSLSTSLAPPFSLTLIFLPTFPLLVIFDLSLPPPWLPPHISNNEAPSHPVISNLYYRVIVGIVLHAGLEMPVYQQTQFYVAIIDSLTVMYLCRFSLALVIKLSRLN